MDDKLSQSTVKIDYVKPDILCLDSLQTVHGGDYDCPAGSIANDDCRANGGAAGGGCISAGTDAAAAGGGQG